MQLIKKMEMVVQSISVQSHQAVIEAVTERDDRRIIFRLSSVVPFFTQDGAPIGISAIPVKSKIIAYVDSRKPLPMIHPPQVTPLIIILEQGHVEGEVVVGQFDQQLYSEQLRLKLQVNATTEIVNIRGRTAQKEDLVDQLLVVFYKTKTPTVPVQISPVKIILTQLEP